MGGISNRAEMHQLFDQHFLRPLEDAISLARRYRDVDSFHSYIARRASLVIAALALIGIMAVACAMVPVMELTSAGPVSALAMLLLTPIVLIGSLFVLGLLFFSWLEERSLARTLRHRTARELKLMRWIRKKLGVDLGRPPHVPWLLAAMFVALPFAMLLRLVPVIATILVMVLIAAPVAFARLDH